MNFRSLRQTFGRMSNDATAYIGSERRPVRDGPDSQGDHMTTERVFIVAQKEFADHITGWHYLVVLALFLGLTLGGDVRRDREVPGRPDEVYRRSDRNGDGG